MSKEQEFVIKYKAAPQWLLELFWLVSAASVFLVMIFGLGMTATDKFNPVAVACGCVCLTFVAMGLLLKQNQIVMKQEGIYFPPHLMPSLNFKRFREWNDIGAVMLVDAEGPDYFETADYESKEMVLHFQSGGNVRLSLGAISMQDLEKFFRASKAWGSTAVFAPELIELKRKMLTGPTQTKQVSFTTIWEEEMQQHFTTMNFVPLDRNKSLQNGRFKIISQLTAGGLSAIYLAERGDKRVVVLKEAVVPANADEQTKQKAKELFDREAKLLLKLTHPRIAKVYDHFVEAGRDYLVIEYIPGQSLRQLVHRSGPQSEDQVLKWAKDICAILHYLHSQDPPIIHRDVSPDNLLLREDGSLFVIDFGAANEFVGTATGTLIGKQNYIAPEQFRGKAQPASDIYALGGTLYYLLTGEEPEALSVSHPSKARDSISVQMDEFVAACTALDVENRIKTSEELRAKIEETTEAQRGVVLKMPGGPKGT